MQPISADVVDVSMPMSRRTLLGFSVNHDGTWADEKQQEPQESQELQK